MAAAKKKKIRAVVKLQILAGSATPQPPIGTALGPHGVNIMQFCKEFNAATQQDKKMNTPVEITIYEDRSFAFITKTPPVADLLKDVLGLKSGSKDPLKTLVGWVTEEQVVQIAQMKMADLNAKDLGGAVRMVKGTAHSMGIGIQA